MEKPESLKFLNSPQKRNCVIITENFFYENQYITRQNPWDTQIIYQQKGESGNLDAPIFRFNTPIFMISIWHPTHGYDKLHVSISYLQ